MFDVRHVSKSFGGVCALDDVSVSMAAGEIHALCGENGAGKSTLIKIMAGSLRPDRGTVCVGGATLPPGDVHAAASAGIAVIHQESTAFLHLDAEDNIFAGQEPRRGWGLVLDRRAMRDRTRALLDRLGEAFDPRRPLAELTVAQRQMVAIARALSRACRLLIMDEPSASLSSRETAVLFRLIRQLRTDGVSVLYVSHRLEEVFDLADRVTVLRDGRWVATRPAADLTPPVLIQLMVGRDLGTPAMQEDASSGKRPGDVVLDVRGLTCPAVFQDVSFSVRAGEIVGLAGLVGAGRSEVAQAIFGAAARPQGDVTVGGVPLPPGSIRAALKAGVVLVPEDRQHLGLVLPMSVGANLTLAVLSSLTRGGLISRRREDELARHLMDRLGVKAPHAAVAAETLSGGNQQKVMLGKWLAPRPRVMLLDEPTRGIDVGAKAEMHRLIRRLADDGMATLLISSELPEILALCDRILVLRQGSIVGDLARRDATQEKILALALPLS